MLQHQIPILVNIACCTQPNGGTIQVTVKGDNRLTKAVVAGVSQVDIYLEKISGGAKVSKKTGSDGKATFANLAPGDYRITFSYKGTGRPAGSAAF